MNGNYFNYFEARKPHGCPDYANLLSASNFESQSSYNITNILGEGLNNLHLTVNMKSVGGHDK